MSCHCTISPLPPHKVTTKPYIQHIILYIFTLQTYETIPSFLSYTADAHSQPNHWIAYFTSTENRHALPIFTSLLNIVCAYDPVGYGLPYNHLMFADSREPLVEVALQVLCVSLDNEPAGNVSVDGTTGGATAMEPVTDVGIL